ncbi:hypothetical protein vseg_009185 [Gypsophila vaccaria]
MALQEEWVITIKQKLEQGGLANHDERWTKHSIYKVPHWMKEEQRPNDDKISGYIPEIISIGPYHHGEPHLQPMEAHKWRVLDHLLSRESQDITLYLTEIKNLENEARDCYESSVGLDSNQFVEMLVLDGCFVLEFLRGSAETFSELEYTEDDPVFNKDSICHVIAMDLMKLENQIPIVVLHKLLEIQYNKPVGIGDAPKLVMSVLTPKWVTLNAPMSEDELNQMRDVVAQEQNVDPMVHCLDVFRRSLMYKPDPRPSMWDGVTKIWAKFKGLMSNCARESHYTNGEHFMAYCISDLRDAGIKFKPRCQLPFWDIHFRERRGVLEIHPFKIDSATETVFRNLIAYEQCHMTRPWDMVVTNYVAFMDNLIDTAADVAYLHEAGIIVHYMGSDAEVADLFNRLVKKVYVSKKTGRLQGVYQKLNEYCRHRRYRWGVSLENEYLSNPWVIISIFAAFLLFVFTAVQTGYTVYAYYVPPS